MSAKLLAMYALLACTSLAQDNACVADGTCGADEVTMLQKISVPQVHHGALMADEHVTKHEKANLLQQHEKHQETHHRTAHQHQHQHKKVDAETDRRSGEPYHISGTVVYYPAKYVLPANAEAAGVPPPMEVANEHNMDPKLAQLGIDFDGIWWMSDNPVPEELVSFANTVVNDTNGGFPATLMVPNSRKGMWSWLTTTVGDILRRYYATGDPDSHTDFVFQSTQEGEITTGLTDVPLVWVDRFPFYKYALDCDETSGNSFLCDPTDCAVNIPGKTCADLINEFPDDMWSRPTVFQDGSWFTDTTYTLKRIVMGNGSAHPVFWDEFMRHMRVHTSVCTYSWSWPFRHCRTEIGPEGEKQMQSYRSDTWCERKHDAVWGLAGCSPEP